MTRWKSHFRNRYNFTGLQVPIAARFQQTVSSAFVNHESGPLHVTMSVGITASREGDTIDSIIARADGYMFEAKKKGRNTIVHDEIDGPFGPEG